MQTAREAPTAASIWRNIMRVLITVADSINQTTMIYNEFILYRIKHYPGEKQILLKTGNEMSLSKEQIPEELEIHCVGKNPIRIRKELKAIIAEQKKAGNSYLFHMNSIRGAFSALLAMLGWLDRSCTVYTLHTTYTGLKLYNKVFTVLDALLANYVTCVSETSLRAFTAWVKRIKGDHMLAIQNGVYTERIDASPENSPSALTRLEEAVYFCYVARMIPIKNHKFLIDVLVGANKNARLIFVGSEDKRQEVRAYAKEKGVADRVIFTGLVPRETAYQWMIDSDVYITPSTLEGLPISLLEGMYCGLPVIMSDIPQHREVAAGADCMSVVKLDVDAWRSEIDRFTNMTPEERKAIGEKCKKHAAEHFSLKAMHGEYDKIFGLAERT